MALHNGPFEAQMYSYCDTRIFTTRRIPRMGAVDFRWSGGYCIIEMYGCGISVGIGDT